MTQHTRIFPGWDAIETLRPALQPGERALVAYLDENLPGEWEIFVQPRLNGDVPDVVIVNKQVGLMVFEVKDWKSGAYQCGWDGEKYLWRVQTEIGFQEIRSPVSQVYHYLDNIRRLYVPDMGKKKVGPRAPLKVGIYFHNMKTDEARKMMKHTPKGCVVIGNDGLAPANISTVVPDVRVKKNSSFEEGWAEDLRFWLLPPFHSLEQGMPIELTPEQKRFAEPSPGRHQRLRGVAGSGKTLVLAQRAANLASQGKRVLIVGYNITLLHYVKDHVSRARFAFNWDRIEFIHFHGFCSNYLSENGMCWPSGTNNKEELFSHIVPQTVIDAMKRGRNAKGRHYDAILIDEGQDFEKKWYDALCCFLTAHDELLLVADERQNLYGRDAHWLIEMRETRFRGRWGELKKSYRLPPNLLNQSNRFAQMFLPRLGIEPEREDINLELFVPHLAWRNESDMNIVKEKVYKAVQWLNRKHNVHPQDIVILVQDNAVGKSLVGYFEKRNYRVNHTFEDEIKSHSQKRAFRLGGGRLKMCTIHSFKGWELLNVIIVTPHNDYKGIEKLDMLMYTAITRARQNLIVFNRNDRYRKYGDAWPQWSQPELTADGLSRLQSGVSSGMLL